MEPLTKPHWEAVPAGIQALLADLGQMPAVQPFYLAGGTVVALRLGHRISRDLDFFSETDSVDTPLPSGCDDETQPVRESPPQYEV